LYKAYLIAAIVMTLSILEGHAPIANFFKCNISYVLWVMWSPCICRASCKFSVPQKYLWNG